MRLLQESRKIGFFGIFGFFGFGFFGFFGFGIFGFLVLVFWLFGSPSRSRGNNYAFLSVLMLIVLFRNSIQVVFLVLQNYLFRYYVSRAASVYSAITWCSGSSIRMDNICLVNAINYLEAAFAILVLRKSIYCLELFA